MVLIGSLFGMQTPKALLLLHVGVILSTNCTVSYPNAPPERRLSIQYNYISTNIAIILYNNMPRI